MTNALALDLGTTNVKAARWDGMRLRDVRSVAAPALEGDDLVRTCAARDYLAAIDLALEGLPTDAPLGVSTQRSSFVLFDADDGRPLTPLISWQDRRAAAWCEARAADAAWITERTGLPLSPHYAGPKLACLLENDPALRTRMADGSIRFGTLETWWLYVRGRGRPHETDVGMAARTLLADPRRGGWDDDLLAYFRVPAAALPIIRPTNGRAVPLESGHEVAATVADQAAAALAVLGADPDTALVNLGTGGFVLRSTGAVMSARAGYLAGPMRGLPDGAAQYSLEGTINGIGEALAVAGGAPDELPAEDPTPGAFCLPDATGWGSPHWCPERTTTYSEAALEDDAGARGRIVLEGIGFRVREILEHLFHASTGPRRVCLAGGLARQATLPLALAACLGRAVEVLDEPEVTLWGAAGLAGAGAAVPPSSRPVAPDDPGRYLGPKYASWRAWLARQVGTSRTE